ncbi:MAG: formate--tetrahydrofolate ligase [Planctomycetes bacterium]|nr:formate--tetrahydrofolate ligase [Planctomycetota bacterium]MCC7397759.1 formate--tetrahydrofolate ligase [Planctomycetota bacterium]
MSLNDLAIARSIPLRPLSEVARVMGLTADDLEPYGNSKAKVRLDMLAQPAKKKAKYVVVTAITPTPLGEGKTVHTVGISQALNRIGQRACCVIRQPSMGPVFGIKGGAAGGGYSQVVPPEELNLHLTGDFHAVTAAHNLCAAFLDAHLFHGNELGLDEAQITWRRVLDMNDRALREVEVAHGGDKNGKPRRTGFDITSASEIMAILGLAKDIHDLRRRLGNIVVGYTKDGRAVTAEDLKAAGAMTAILKDALKPTLMQTLEGTPALVHTGPFANIAHGNSSIVADYVAMRCLDFVVTEAGFGADMGAEKFFDIKCRASGLVPDAALLVATVRALKMHSGRFEIKAGKPLPEGLQKEDLDALAAGIGNLQKQIENVRLFGIPVVVAINQFPTDSEAEIAFVRDAALQAGAAAAHVSTLFADGGKGGEDLAHALVAACEQPSSFRLLYADDASLKEKIETLATRIYGADGVDYEPEAEKQLALFEERGYGRFPICMAKTQYSLSHDANLKGRPTGYRFKVRDARVAVGAGFVYPLAGEIMTMPGLGKVPGGARMDIDQDGNVVGML